MSVIDVETGQIGTVSEDTVVYLNATIKYGEAELLKTVAVTVKFIGEGLQLEYHFDFESGGGKFLSGGRHLLLQQPG